MPGSWRIQENSLHVHERPLGTTELIFYWDGQFSGTADTVKSVNIVIENGDPSTVLSTSRISAIWVALKHQFPLLGCRVERRSDTDVFFVVDQQALRTVSSFELELRPVASAEEATEIVDQIVTGPRLLSDGLQARIFAFPRTDEPRHCHIALHLAHCITDGVSNILLLRRFLDYLHSPPSESVDFRNRLSLTLASEDLFPSVSFNNARRLWIKVVSNIISSNRMGQLSGGHTLPRRVTSTTMFTPAHSSLLKSSLSAEDSRRLIQNCRRHRITFGNVYPVLGQVALVRVLLRKYLRGEINEEEWEFRKREPMSTGGPINLRPYYNEEWRECGGPHNVAIFIGFTFLLLPFMPLGEAQNIKPGMVLPTFSQLLTPSRLLLRARSVRKQMASVIQSPLSLDVLKARLPGRVQTLRELVQAVNRSPQITRDPTLLTPMEQSRKGFVFTHGGSSFGNVDLMLPLEYGSENGIKIAIDHTGTRLHCRPMELYLGAETSKGQLHMSVFFDKNVYGQEIVEEWLKEIRDATLHYLGQDIARI